MEILIQSIGYVCIIGFGLFTLYICIKIILEPIPSVKEKIEENNDSVYSIPSGLSGDDMMEYIAYRSIKDNKNDNEAIIEEDYKEYDRRANYLKIINKKGDIKRIQEEIDHLNKDDY